MGLLVLVAVEERQDLIVFTRPHQAVVLAEAARIASLHLDQELLVKATMVDLAQVLPRTTVVAAVAVLVLLALMEMQHFLALAATVLTGNHLEHITLVVAQAVVPHQDLQMEVLVEEEMQPMAQETLDLLIEVVAALVLVHQTQQTPIN